MKAKNVKIGGIYRATVSGKAARVRIDCLNLQFGGWWATNLETGREIRIKTAARLHYPLAPETDTYNNRKFNDDGSFTIVSD